VGKKVGKKIKTVEKKSSKTLKKIVGKKWCEKKWEKN